MSNVIETLALLLSDETARTDFHRSPKLFLDRFNLEEVDKQLLLEMEPRQLEIQAKALLSKRLSEIRKLIPATSRALGVRIRNLFLDYSTNHWPTGYKRHLLYTAMFCEYLASIGEPGIHYSELNRLQFALGHKRIAIFLIRRSDQTILTQCFWRGRRNYELRFIVLDLIRRMSSKLKKNGVILKSSARSYVSCIAVLVFSRRLGTKGVRSIRMEFSSSLSSARLILVACMR